MKTALPALLLLFGLASSASMSACRKKPMTEAERRMKAPLPELRVVERRVEEMKKNGFLRRIEPEKNVAYVQRDLWALSSYNLRKLDAYAMAHYCGLKAGTQEFRVEIKIIGTDQTVATWDMKSGYMPVR